MHKRNSKQTLNHGLVLNKMYRIIKFKQKSLVKIIYFYINIDLRKKEKNDFEKKNFKLMNNAVFEKTMEDVRKYRDINLVTTEKRRNYLVSESNCHTTKFFTENLLAIEMKKTQILMH